MNAARHHTDQADDRTESLVETHMTLAAKLREIRYREPVLPECDDTAAMQRHLRAREAYLTELTRSPGWSERTQVLIAAVWHWFAREAWPRISHAAIALVLIMLTAIACIVSCAVKANGGELSGRWTTAEVTAYCPCALCCGTSADGITADGTRTRRVPYAFAADRSLPFGAQVFVPVGLGVLDQVCADCRWFRVDDRGGALDSEAARYGILRLDLRVRDHWWAVRFGRRVLPVFVTSTN